MSEPYKLYGDSELEAINSLAHEVLSAWKSDWINDNDAPLSILLTDARTQPLPDGDLGYEFEIEGHCIRFVSSRANVNRLLALVCKIRQGLGSISESGVMSEIVVELVKDLISSIVSRLGNINAVSIDDLEPCQQSEKRESLNDIYLLCSLGEAEFALVVPYSLISIMPAKREVASAEKIALAKRDHCEIVGSVTISLKIGEVELDYMAISNISPGDVIRLDKKLDAPLVFEADSGMPVCAAYLGKQGESKAAKIILDR